MPEIVPFVSRETNEANAQWLVTMRNMLPDAQVKVFNELTPEERAAARVAIVANPDPVDLAALPNLKWVQSLWAGVERIVAELPNAPFDIVRMIDPQLAETMSEAVLAWTLYLHRDMPRYRAQQNEHMWRQLPMRMARERTIGILGLGELGRVAAQRLTANGFGVHGWRRSKGDQIDGLTVHTGDEGLETILKHSEILVILLPLTMETTGLLNEKTLARLPMGASLINFGRGAIIDDLALIKQLDQGHLSHAVLDVFATEPLPATHPFWMHPDVTVLPHISAPTSVETAAKIAADNIRAYLNDGTIPAAIDRHRGY